MPRHIQTYHIVHFWHHCAPPRTSLATFPIWELSGNFHPPLCPVSASSFHLRIQKKKHWKDLKRCIVIFSYFFMIWFPLSQVRLWMSLAQCLAWFQVCLMPNLCCLDEELIGTFHQYVMLWVLCLCFRFSSLTSWTCVKWIDMWLTRLSNTCFIVLGWLFHSLSFSF